MILVPDMVRVPQGRFMMGSPDDEPGRLAVEGPQHQVTIAAAFNVSKFAITREQFDGFVSDSGYAAGATCQIWRDGAWHEARASYLDPGFPQTPRHPAVCVSWCDAQSYSAWLRAHTGRAFRLLTEAEWEYAARAGTTSAYWWGRSATPENANFDFSKIVATPPRQVAPRYQTVAVDHYAPNPFGLFHMHGNVWEWVADCYAPDYTSAHSDGRANPGTPNCKRVLRGGGWLNGPHGVRSARRHAAGADFRRSDAGFRIAESV